MNSGNIKIERVAEEDQPGVMAVMKSANMHRVPSPEVPSLDWDRFWMVKLEGRVVGAAGYRLLENGDAKTTLMAVLPEVKGKGIGLALQAHRMREALTEGCRKMHTSSDIPATIEWYKKHFGYETTGNVQKLHEFGRPDIDTWTSMKTDLREWQNRENK